MACWRTGGGTPRKPPPNSVNPLRGGLGVCGGIEFLAQVEGAGIPAALLKKRFYFGRNPLLLFDSLLLFRNEPVVAAFVHFDHSFLHQALQDGQGPPLIFAESPFAVGPAADFPGRHKLARVTVQIRANLCGISIHNIAW